MRSARRRNRRNKHDAGKLMGDKKGPVVIASWEHDGRLRLRILKRNSSKQPIGKPRIPIKRGAIAIDDPGIVWCSPFYYNTHLGKNWKVVKPMSAEHRRLMIEKYLNPATLSAALSHDGVSWRS